MSSFDPNGRGPFPDHSFDAIHTSQVIEHIHNTRLFLLEARRILVPGGTVVITSENLSSLLNWTALSLGYAPFSLQQVCGWYVGNPLGLHAQEKIAIESVDTLDAAHPAFSGMFGHIRVLTVSQAQDLLRQVGFENIVVRSIGMMPLPTCLGRPLERWFTRRGHWLLMEARAPSRELAGQNRF